MHLYVHVPFCLGKCRYCGFFSVPMDMDLLEVHTTALIREIRHFGRRLGRPRVRTVFFGGGTPSVLPPWALSRLMPEVGRNFVLEDGAEWSFEVNPGTTVDQAYFRELAGYGVNRLSLGIQSFSESRLMALGRPHTAAQAAAAFLAARGAGFRNLGCDLMFGLPGQRLKLWLDDLKRVADLGPEHLSCYNLTLEEGTPLAADAAAGALALPSESEQARMFVRGAEFLEERGYLQYEISNFARLGFACRHNRAYWEGRDYLGLGAGAVSTLGGRRRENPRDIAAYARMCAGSGLDAGWKELSPGERIREMVMLSLRTTRGLSLAAYRKLSGRDFLKDNEAMIRALRQKELIRIVRGRLSLTKTGFLVENVILARLDY